MANNAVIMATIIRVNAQKDELARTVLKLYER